MSDFDPGEGWRHASDEEAQEGTVETVMHYSLKSGWTNWVREEPMPSLPTEPYTVALVSFDDDRSGVYLLAEDGTWYSPFGYGVMTESTLRRITGFEVLSEPRAVTAKAVLDRVEDVLPKEGAVLLIPVRQEFNQ